MSENRSIIGRDNDVQRDKILRRYFEQNTIFTKYL